MPGQETAVAVTGQVRGALPGGAVLPVAALVQRQRADRRPGPARHDRDDDGHHDQVGHGAVAEHLGAVHPPGGVRVTRLRARTAPTPAGRAAAGPAAGPATRRAGPACGRTAGSRRRPGSRPGPPSRARRPASPGPGTRSAAGPAGRCDGRAGCRGSSAGRGSSCTGSSWWPCSTRTRPPPGSTRSAARQSRAPVISRTASAVLMSQASSSSWLPIGVDDLAAALGHREQGGAQGVVLAQDLRRGGLREAEQLDDVTGQHHGDRARLGGQAARQHLARRARRPPVRRGGRCRSLTASTGVPAGTCTSSRSGTSGRLG